ncbi:Gfo/Idh/MocA family oxidoreductase [Microbacterium hominis]|uniref:Gfo/Idh/MocA family protein n=1 Tax=Microbacterium TaxID=33882 RepID=UPI00168B999A|nr:MULTISPECIES: Gfo/Idh/MocA family oxidoreductase [Microbacterium]QOC26972.1 Gfo/Idh/MocA family oxidoreductase [Microbacterium hominis]QOC28134.1 Gfo/Idh/MocA family oxidoreductase [Microbacterium hominis]QYF96694.1 Gfo/Idh/MocA family oxidoreductase [Microbacterium sp. PAMC21962]
MIRLATIGTSTITEKFADAVAQTPGIRIDVVFSRDADRGRAFADRLGIDRVSTDLDALLATGEVDAVYVGSPNGAHAAQAAAAIAAGVHVFLEKPATPTADEFARLVDDARDRGVVVFEGMRNVYDPGMSRLRELLPRVGAVRLVSFGQSQRSARYDLVLAGETPNIFDPALAGGALFDLGVYPLSAAIELFGAPSRVLGATVAIATGADGAGAAVLDYDGFVAQIAFSKIGASRRPNEIQGELGTIEIDEITAPRRLVLDLFSGIREEIEIDGPDNNMQFEVARFAALVRGEADPAPDQRRSLEVLRTVEAIRAGDGARGPARP